MILHGSAFCNDSDTKDNSPKIIYESIKLDLKFVYFMVKFVFNCTLVFCSLFYFQRKSRVEIPDSCPDFRDKFLACLDFPDQNQACPDFRDHDNPSRLLRPKRRLRDQNITTHICCVRTLATE